MTPVAVPRDLLLDVSRLIWRRWAGRLPTGIDRVCLAYLDRFAVRACAVVQWRGRVRVLSPGLSDRLFGLIRRGGPGFRVQFAALVPAIMVSRRDPGAAVYLNVGHTGLDAGALPRWIAAHRLRAVFLIHDLIPITHPQFCRAGEAPRHAARIAHALRAGSGIIANSAATLAVLATYAQAQGLPLPPAISARISGPSVVPRPAAKPPAPRPWFVTLGTIEGRKNHLLLLQVWQKLVQTLGTQTPTLVIVGQRGWLAEPALAMIDTDAAIRPYVVEHSHADDAALGRLIMGARALLMPSFAEGFGLPLIEALQLGTPVIASHLPVFREIAGAIPLYLDPADAPGWQAAIIAYCGDGPDRARQIAAMDGYRAPTWDDHFARVEPWLAAQFGLADS